MGHNDLKAFVEDHQQLFVLTGAGCSTNSGIPDYRDADGSWKRTPPVRFQAFIADAATRRRYWARSMIGWRRFGQARPNDAHHALARLEASGRSRMLLTQNVDRLHQAAGSREVIDLHGRLDLVRCMACAATLRRVEFQNHLTRLNAAWANLEAAALSIGIGMGPPPASKRGSDAYSMIVCAFMARQSASPAEDRAWRAHAAGS